MSANLISAALSQLRPGAEWSLIGDTIEGLVWMDAFQQRPSDAEINQEVARLLDDGFASRHQVAKSTVLSRIGDEKAEEAFSLATVGQMLRWNAPDKPMINSDDPETIAILRRINLDPDVILAPE